MPVAINFTNGDEPAIHEEGENWEYINNGDNTIIRILDGYDITVADAIAQNVEQVQYLTDEEFDEVIGMLE